MIANRALLPSDAVELYEQGERKRERLRYTVAYAYEHSPFYRDLMDEAGVAPADVRTFADLADLPVVDGDDVLANQPPAADRFRFRNVRAPLRRPFATSGSGGRPKTVFMSYDEVAAFYYGTGARGFAHFGFTPEDMLVNYNPFVGLNPSCVFAEGAVEALGGATLPVSNTPYPPERHRELLERHDPDVMMALPSHAAALGRRLDAAGVAPADLGLDAVYVAGEPVGRQRSEGIAETFGAPVRRFYAATEVGGIGFECLDGPGYHVLDDRIHVEIVDRETGAVLPEGERGSVVLTRLLHPGEEAAMPLLRYAVGDVAAVHRDGDACDCGFGGPTRLVRPTLGEWEVTVGGVNLSTTFVEDALYGDPALADAVEEYQLHLRYDADTGRDVLEVHVATGNERGEIRDVTATGDVPALARAVGDALVDAHSHLRDAVETVGAARIDVRLVEDIDLGDGKPTRVVDHRDLE